MRFHKRKLFSKEQRVSGGIDNNGIIINFPTLYFTTPIGMTNGQASTATAAAMYAAQQETSIWYEANSHLASEDQVYNYLYKQMRDHMRGIGGTVSTINTYNMINPAPYKIDLISLNNCD